MKITVYYEDNREKTTIEVPDSDCEVMIEEDYRSRLDSAKDKSTVVRRTAQQIIDEECNKPTYNNHHSETRRHVSLDAYDPMGDTLTDGSDPFCGIEGDEIERSSQARFLRRRKAEGYRQSRRRLPSVGQYTSEPDPQKAEGRALGLNIFSSQT